MTNTSGVVTKTYVYNAFGEEEDISTTGGNPFRYCGEYYVTACGTPIDLQLGKNNIPSNIPPYASADNVRDMLSLTSGNTAEFMTEFVIPKGTTVLTGVASAFHKNTAGGGIQWWVSHVEK